MNKLKKGDVPQKRGLTVDEIISKYPMTVRILLVQLVEQVERLQKEKPAKKPTVDEEFVKIYIDMIKEDPHECLRENLIGMLREAGVEVIIE